MCIRDRSHLGMIKCRNGTLSPSIFSWRSSWGGDQGQGQKHGGSCPPRPPFLAPPMLSRAIVHAGTLGLRCTQSYAKIKWKGKGRLALDTNTTVRAKNYPGDLSALSLRDTFIYLKSRTSRQAAGRYRTNYITVINV